MDIREDRIEMPMPPENYILRLKYGCSKQCKKFHEACALNPEECDIYRQNNLNTGHKLDVQKMKWSLMPWAQIEEVLKVLMKGEEKYGAFNWQKVMPKDRYIDAAMRHLIAYQKGEKLDKEWGTNHLAHVACCCLFKLWEDMGEQTNKTTK